jgi:Flp pilus assembly protein CpaB
MARTMRSAPRVVAVPSSNGDRAASVVSLSAPKRRRPTWVVFGAVMVGLAMLLGVWVFSTSSERISVMVAARDIAPGEVIDATDLRVVEMGRTGELRAIKPSQQQLIVGQSARGPIPEGTVLNTGLFAVRDRVIPAGQVVVGAALEPGAAPVAGLAAGDRVDVLAVVKATGAPTTGSPVATVVASGTVWSVQSPGTGAVSSKQVVSVLIPAEAQAVVAQAAADGRLRLSLVGVSG